MKTRIAAAALAGLFAASAAQATLLYDQPFDYGNSTFVINGFDGWSTGSGVVDYDHDGGLDHAAMLGEIGGSMYHDHPSGNRGGPQPITVNPFPTDTAGEDYWFAGLIQLANHSGTSRIQFTNGQGVNTIGFGIDQDGDVILNASDNGGAASGIDTGIDAAADGSTYLFLVRGTVGTGTSPTNSTVEFWFNPADTSSVAALGTGANYFTTGADSKFGRDSGAYSSASVNISFQSRADELRIGESLADVIGVPEPGSLALLGLGTLLMLGRGRKRA